MQEDIVLVNVFIIGQVSIQNHPKVFSSVFRYEVSSHKGKVRSDQSRMPLLAANSINLVLLNNTFNQKIVF